MKRLVVVSALLAGGIACGGSSGGGVDSGSGTPADAAIDAYPTAAHPAYPQVPNLGGPRLPHPQVYTVTFGSDARAPQLEAFAQWIVGSQWLATVGAEYGIGSGSAAGAVHDPQTPPAAITSAEIEAYLGSGVTSGAIPKPAAPFTLADALYVVYYPQATHITTTFVDGIIKKSCTDFGGYHGEVHQNGLDFAYAAIPTCGGNIPGLDAVGTVEEIVSHEILEAATDAMPITAPAYQLHADPEDAWYSTFEFEVELGDMCEAPTRFVMEDGFPAQRTWSNAAAAAGGEPCVPVDPSLPVYGISAPTATQHVAAGSAVDIPVTGWSTGPLADWQLTPEFFGGTRLTVQVRNPTLNNGVATMVHVAVPASVASGSHASYALVSAHTTDGSDGTMWPLAIDVP